MRKFRMLVVLLLMIFTVAIHASGSFAGSTDGVFLGWERDETATEQMGEAAADASDRERAAKRYAMQEAVRKIVGEEISSASMVENFTLVYDKVYTKMSGFVRGVKKVGQSFVKDGIYYQNYAIIVSPPALDKALLESSIEARIDIPAIYESINSPRIAMAIVEKVVDENGRETLADPDLHSESRIQKYFKKRNPDFYFLSLPTLAGSMADKPDWVELGRKNDFDVIIVGEIKTSFLLKIDKKIRGAGRDIVVPMYRYHSELTWNIINLSTSTREIAIHEVFDKGSATAGSGPVAARKFAKDKVLEDAVPRLFTDLMLNWVQTVYYSPYEIIFAGTEAHLDGEIGGKLRRIKQIVPESVKSRGSIRGKLVYNLKVQGTLGELASSLQKKFAGYELSESRAGRVVLAKAGGSKKIFELTVKNSSFTQSDDYFRIIKNMSEIWAVSEPQLIDGAAVFTVTTTSSLRDVARTFEKKLSIRIVTMDRNRVVAEAGR